MSVEEMQRKKFDLLCKLERLKRKGVIVPRTYTMNSPYEEIKYEYDKLHNERLMDNSVKMYLVAEEILRGDRLDPSNAFQYDHIHLNLPGTAGYNPSLA